MLVEHLQQRPPAGKAAHARRVAPPLRPRSALRRRVQASRPHQLRVRARVANRGRLPTCVTSRGASLARFEPVRATLRPADGWALLSGHTHVELGHLAAIAGGGCAEWFVRRVGGAVPGTLGRLAVAGACGGDVGCDVRV